MYVVEPVVLLEPNLIQDSESLVYFESFETVQ